MSVNSCSIPCNSLFRSLGKFLCPRRNTQSELDTRQKGKALVRSTSRARTPLLSASFNGWAFDCLGRKVLIRSRVALEPPPLAVLVRELARRHYHLHVVELRNPSPTAALTLSTSLVLCYGVMGKPIQHQMVVLGIRSPVVFSSRWPAYAIFFQSREKFLPSFKRVFTPIRQMQCSKRLASDERWSVRGRPQAFLLFNCSASRTC